MKNKLLKQARHEYSLKQRSVFLLLLAPIFLLLLPWLFIGLGAEVNRWLGLPPVFAFPLNLILGALISLAGGALAMWAIYSQFTLGRGTPVPLMATQKLIVQPPFTYCRNPMALGTFGMYTGLGIVWHSIGAVLLVLIFAGLLLLYIKHIEEKEMELRFGTEYLDYKQRTPFLFPRFRVRN